MKKSFTLRDLFVLLCHKNWVPEIKEITDHPAKIIIKGFDCGQAAMLLNRLYIQVIESSFKPKFYLLSFV